MVASARPAGDRITVGVMRAITIREPGGPDVLAWTEVRDPEPGPDEVLIDVAATAVNRADLLQRQGHYPPPKGASDVLGLECSGTVAAVGSQVSGWRVGDEVCALLAGGGYAERVAVPAAQVLPLPEGVDLVTAASLPEVACTVWSNVVMVAGLRSGETLLVHGGAGGIGTHAIQVAKALGARVAVTAGSAERLERCAGLGADVLVNYREQDFVAEVGEADVVLDNMGAAYLGRNVDVLAPDGRLVVIGMQGGVKAELNIGRLLAKRGSVTGTGLRSRPVDGPNGKGRIVAEVRERLWPLIASGQVKPIVHEVLPVERAADAHRALEGGDVFGKVVLRV
jgi:putative PIG3 family NAD(P)H quinone oxidoreductase